MSALINLRMTDVIEFCLEVHDFCCQCGCFIAIGKAKFWMQQAICNGVTAYQIYLDLQKAYDSINHPGILVLIEKYKVGP